ncbi:hypothetical protein BGZ65_000250, partial [Modicella reniformis]
MYRHLHPFHPVHYNVDAVHSPYPKACANSNSPFNFNTSTSAYYTPFDFNTRAGSSASSNTPFNINTTSARYHTPFNFNTSASASVATPHSTSIPPVPPSHQKMIGRTQDFGMVQGKRQERPLFKLLLQGIKKDHARSDPGKGQLPTGRYSKDHPGRGKKYQDFYPLYERTGKAGHPEIKAQFNTFADFLKVWSDLPVRTSYENGKGGDRAQGLTKLDAWDLRAARKEPETNKLELTMTWLEEEGADDDGAFISSLRRRLLKQRNLMTHVLTSSYGVRIGTQSVLFFSGERWIDDYAIDGTLAILLRKYGHRGSYLFIPIQTIDQWVTHLRHPEESLYEWDWNKNTVLTMVKEANKEKEARA